ncbi:MAG TPA: outer membrane beta-barrel protein [Usitatibacter sp.]|nr:outer membrane beta-barrel protein [Usitatibacter sp.]
MLKKSLITALAAAGLATAAAPAFAQTDYRAPWRGDFWGYVGASGGESKFRTDCNRTITQFECDRKDTGFKVYAGGKMSEVLGLEVGYTDFGRIRTNGGDTDAWAVPISLTVGAPIGPRFAAFGKVGGVYARTDVTTDLNDTFSARGDRNGWGWTYGAGATFAITPTVQIRADWDRYKLDFVGGRRDVDMLTAGLQLRF